MGDMGDMGCGAGWECVCVCGGGGGEGVNNFLTDPKAQNLTNFSAVTEKNGPVWGKKKPRP